MRGIRKAVLAAVSVLSALSLSACGGGSSNNTPIIPATPGVSQGVITALGSIFVNGIEYNIDNAIIRIDDNPSTKDQLKPGMIVKVRGVDNGITGTASQVEARDILEGTISALGANTITVMGQTVQIEDNVTRLNDDNTQKTFAQAGFQLNDHVEVHGFADDQGGLRATRVFKKAPGTGEFEAKGFVVATGAGSFDLARTAGGAAFLTVTGTLPAGAGVGSLVEIKSAAAPVAGAVTATLVKLEDRLGVAGEKVEVEGLVSSGTVDDFVINGQRVQTTSATLFQGGLKADFATGIKLEAEGALNGSGILIASKISFRSNIKLVGDVSNLGANSFTILGKTVATNNFTSGAGALANGAHLEVRATLDRDGNLLATRVVANNSNKFFVQGPLTNSDATAGTLTVLGITATTNGATQYRLSTTSTESAVTKNLFFASLIKNLTVVKLRWSSADTAAAIEEAEIEMGK